MIRSHLRVISAVLAAGLLIAVAACGAGAGSVPNATGTTNLANTVGGGSPQGVRKLPHCTVAAVSEPIQVSASFSPARFQAGLYSNMTITLTSPPCWQGPKWYTPVTFEDILPSGLYYCCPASGPGISSANTCGGSLSAPIDGFFIQLTNGMLSAIPGSSCQMIVQVYAFADGTYTNTMFRNAVASPQSAISNAYTTPPLTVFGPLVTPRP